MRSVTTAVLAAALASPVVLLGGCDKEVHTEHSRSTNPLTGTTTTEDKQTYQRSDGSTYTETQTHKSD